MKKLMVFALVMVVVGVTILQVGAVPTVPPIPEPPPVPPEPPPETPEPPSGGGGLFPIMEDQQKFEVISAEPVMEGYAGGSIDFNLKVIQKGYPDLVVNLTADIPDKWRASFSKNDFDLRAEESVELRLSLSPPESVSAEQHEIKIEAVGTAKEDSLEVTDSVTVTAMTYLIDVGVANLQLSSMQPRPGENVTVTATAVNYTQRTTADVAVEFLVNNGLISRQTVTLTAGASQAVTFGWTAQSGTSNLVVKTKAAGDTNRRNDTVAQQVNLPSGTEQIDMLYQQATAYYFQEEYAQARDTFAAVEDQYNQMGETAKALEAGQYKNLCDSYLQAQTYMNQGDQAYQMENYEEAAQNYRQARDIYSSIGDTEKQAEADQKLKDAEENIKFNMNILYIGVAIALVVMVALVTRQISRRRSRPARPARQPSSRFRLEEPVSQAPPPATRPVSTPTREPPPTTGAAPPAELVQFHQKTEDALSRFTKGYIRDNLQQAMRVYLSLEGERKQLPRSKDLELERIIDTNLKELEHRIFGTF